MDTYPIDHVIIAEIPVIRKILHEKWQVVECWITFDHSRWIFPFIGHIGICTSSGIIRDFAGSYFVSEDQMGFGDPTKYLQLEISKVPGGVTAWDRAVQDASEEYKSHMV